MTHVKALQAGQSSQGTFESITPVQYMFDEMVGPSRQAKQARSELEAFNLIFSLQWRIYGGVRGGQDPPTSHGSGPHLQGPYLPGPCSSQM